MIKFKVDEEIFKLEQFVFSGGEVQVKLPCRLIGHKCEHITVIAELKNSDDVMALMMAVDALSRSCTISNMSLYMSYAPYARQDRACDAGEALSCKVFAGMINTLGFSSVVVDDCHSDVLVGMIDNCLSTPVASIVELFPTLLSIISFPDTVLISPDAGASKKTLDVAMCLSAPNVIRADKIRDVKTGEITGTAVYSDDLSGKCCVIIDDICDGGMTFIKLSEQLKLKGAESVILYVTHGIFSRGLGYLFQAGIDQIYCKNSFSHHAGTANFFVKTYL